MGRKAPRKRLTRRVMACPTGVPPSTRTSLGAPPTPRWGERSKDANPGRKNAPRERDGLFDIVSRNDRCSLSHVPDAMQRERQRSGASLIRDRHGLKVTQAPEERA